MIWNQLLAGSGPDAQAPGARACRNSSSCRLSPIDGFYPPYVIGAYWDVLTANVVRQFPHAARTHHAQRRHGVLPQHQGKPQGRRQRPAARRELRARGHAALHHRAVRTQSGRHAATRRQQPAHRNLRPERHHESRARVHRLRLGLSGEWRHLHQCGLARLRRAQHALRNEPDVVQPGQPLEPGGDVSSARPFPRTRRAPRRCASRSTGCSTMRTPARSSRGR